MSLIIYEINEVPKRLFNFYSETHPNSAFARLYNYSCLFETYSPEIDH